MKAVWLALVIGFIARIAVCGAGPEVMLNLDGDLYFTGATPELSVAKLQQSVDDIARAGVQTITASIGAGSDILYYRTEVANRWGWRMTSLDEKAPWKTRLPRYLAATAAGLDAPRIIADRARERGLRFIPSYRMNDAHYCSDPLNHPLTGKFWMEHQDFTVGQSPIPGAESYRHLLSFAHEEVRAYRLAVIFEAIDRYADVMDGFELDFNRFQVFFPPGEAERHAHLITTMVEQVRARLDMIGEPRGRRLRLVVRVPPALHNCRWAGLEVEAWMQHGLVNVVIPTQIMTLAHDLPLDEFVRIAKPAGVQVFGSLHGRGGFQWPFSTEHNPAAYTQPVTRTPDAAQILGAAANQRHLGASGYELYNFNFFSTAAPFMSAVGTGLTAPDSLSKNDRRYQITQAYFRDHEDTYENRKQVPTALPPGQAVTLRLLIGEDLAHADPLPRFVGLRLGLHGANRGFAGLAMSVALNGQRIHEGEVVRQLVVTTGKRRGGGSHAPPTEAYAQWPIADLGVLRAGWNDVEIIVAPGGPQPPLQLVELELGVLPAR